MPELLGEEDAWPIQQFPAESVWKNRLADWLRKGPGAWSTQRDKVAAVAAAVVQEYKQHSGGGRVRWGVGGIGWGALMAAWAGTEGALSPAAPAPTAVCALSPQLYDQDVQLAKALSAPLIILPSKYDSMDKLQVFISARKYIYEQCYFKRFGMCKPGLLSYAPLFTAYDPDEMDRQLGQRNPQRRVRGRAKQVHPLQLAKAELKAVGQASEMMHLAAQWMAAWLSGQPPAPQERGVANQEQSSSGDDDGGDGDDGGDDAAEGEESGASGDGESSAERG